MKFLNKQLMVKHLLVASGIWFASLGGVALITNEILVNHQKAISALIEQKQAPTDVTALVKTVEKLNSDVAVLAKGVSYNTEDISGLKLAKREIESKPVSRPQPRKPTYAETCDQQKNQLHYELFNMPAPGCEI